MLKMLKMLKSVHHALWNYSMHSQLVACVTLDPVCCARHDLVQDHLYVQHINHTIVSVTQGQKHVHAQNILCMHMCTKWINTEISGYTYSFPCVLWESAWPCGDGEMSDNFVHFDHVDISCKCHFLHWHKLLPCTLSIGLFFLHVLDHSQSIPSLQEQMLMVDRKSPDCRLYPCTV